MTTPLSTEITLHISGLSNLTVLEMEGCEALSSCFSYTLYFSSATQKLNIQDLQGKTASLELFNTDTSQTQYLHGCIDSFSIIDSDKQSYSEYIITLVPTLFLLRHNQYFQNYANCTRLEVLSALLKKMDVDCSRLQLQENPEELIVCYHESLYNFITRLLAEAGIDYYFKHEKDRHTLVLDNTHVTTKKEIPLETFFYQNPQLASKKERHRKNKLISKTTTLGLGPMVQVKQQIIQSIEHRLNRNKQYTNQLTSVLHIAPQTKKINSALGPVLARIKAIKKSTPVPLNTLQFHWEDQPKNFLCQSRQAWAGKDHGVLFTPQPDQAVIVDWLQANPAKPIVLGGLLDDFSEPAFSKTQASGLETGLQSLCLDKQTWNLSSKKNMTIALTGVQIKNITRHSDWLIENHFQKIARTFSIQDFQKISLGCGESCILIEQDGLKIKSSKIKIN